jgi:NAD(P)-dependent dehydrogenase (short-subunit alcohol dehydrogenase family)
MSAVVTGANSGLGRATVRLLAGRGVDVLAIDRISADEWSSPFSQLSAEVTYAQADITDDSALAEAFANNTLPRSIRAVVHCAGRGGDRARILTKDRMPADLASFTEVIRVNLVGTFNVLRTAASHMSRNEVVDGDRGSIVLTASIAAFDGQIGQTAYAASKAGVHGLTLVAARDLASWQIRVNTIAPGTFDTPMLGELRPDIRDALAASIPHPARLGDPEDYAHLAVSLIENPYINGATVRLDGALRMAPR